MALFFLYAVLFLPAVVSTKAKSWFESPRTQKAFSDVVARNADTMLVASLSSDHSSDIRDVTFVDDMAIVKCASIDKGSRDFQKVIAVASAIVCDIDFQDLGRISVIASFQDVVERTLSLLSPIPHSRKKVFLECSGFIGDDSKATEEAIRTLALSTWEAAAKPVRWKGSSISDYFDIHIVLIPARQPNQSGLLHKRILASGGEFLSTEMLSVALESARSSTEAAALSFKIGIPNDSHQGANEVLKNALLSRHEEAAFDEFMAGIVDLTAELGSALENFGSICNESIDQTLGTFDALTADLEETGLKSAKRKELLNRILEQLQPLYRLQLGKLEESAWELFRKGLVKLRKGDPSLLQEMESIVKNVDIFFRDTANKMVCQDAPWSSEKERREMTSKMRSFVTERLQESRLQGSYVPGMHRKPVAVSLHYLATHPFQMLDALQDALSYEEDMDWQPDSGPSKKKTRGS